MKSRYIHRTFIAPDQRMRELGVDFAQGYHVGRPFPVEEIAARAQKPGRPHGLHVA